MARKKGTQPAPKASTSKATSAIDKGTQPAPKASASKVTTARNKEKQKAVEAPGKTAGGAEDAENNEKQVDDGEVEVVDPVIEPYTKRKSVLSDEEIAVNKQIYEDGIAGIRATMKVRGRPL